MLRQRLVLTGAALVALAACSDSATAPQDQELVDVSFMTALAGFGEVQSSFAAGDGDPEAFEPGMRRGPGLMGPRGPRRGPAPMGGQGGGVMGGGLDMAFVGGVGAGRGHDRGPFGFPNPGQNCSYDEGTGDITCTFERRGLTITRIVSWKTEDGTPQPRPDRETTHSVRVQNFVEGTITKPHATTTIDAHSDRTVVGLSLGSTERVVNGTSRGEEHTTGERGDGTGYTALRVAGDTIIELVVPVTDDRPTYPIAGTVIREMTVTITHGDNTAVRNRREVITYDGSSTATVVITQNGETKTCKMPLPRGHLICD